MTYPGGKNGSGVYQAIINQMPPHEMYIEPFLGSGAVMRNKLRTRYNIGIDVDPETVAAARRVFNEDHFLIFETDAIGWLSELKKWNGRELIYCDPPYMIGTRSTDRQIYRHELDDWQHIELIRILKQLPCMVMVSGYESELYSSALRDWRLVTFTGQTRGAPAVEHLWCNFPEPAALHDYRYLGSDFRERERINRKAKRWRAKLDNLPELERRAVLSACLSDLASPVLPVSAEPPATIARNGEARSPIVGSGEARVDHRHT